MCMQAVTAFLCCVCLTADVRISVLCCLVLCCAVHVLCYAAEAAQAVVWLLSWQVQLHSARI